MANAPHYAPGKYACRITSQAMTESSTGKPQFVLKFTVMGLVDPKDPTSYIPANPQYERPYYKSLTENTMAWFTQDLETLGFTGSSFKDLESDCFVGLDVDMWCNHKDDQNGKPREDWSIVHKDGKGGGAKKEVKPLEAKKIRELDNLFGKHLRGFKGNGEKVTLTPADVGTIPAGAFTASDDDVPF